MSSYKSPISENQSCKGSNITNEAIYRKLSKGVSQTQQRTVFDTVINLLCALALVTVTSYLFLRGML